MNARYIFRVIDNAMRISRFVDGEYGGGFIGQKERGDEGFWLGDQKLATEIRLPYEVGDSIEIKWNESDQLFKLNFEQNGCAASIWANGFYVVLD